MTDPVNLENLREMTGGDTVLEKELFDVFIASSENCLSELRANMEDGKEDNWRTHAHAWKGMSLNLGADILGNLCAEAQINYMASTDQKSTMLTGIEAEFIKVRDYLNNIVN